MPLSPFAVYGKIHASDSTTPFPDVTVYLRNSTKKEEKSMVTNSAGEYVFDLSSFDSGYSDGDSLEFRAELGSFYSESTDTVSGSSLNKDLTLGEDTLYMKLRINLMREELVVFLRNKIPDPKERLTVKTETFVADGSTVKFELSERNAKNIHFVRVGSTMKSIYTEYYVDYKDKNTLNNPVVYLLTPPSNTSQVDIRYSYGTSSWVYPDLPKIELTVDDYPRINVDINSFKLEEFSFGGLATKPSGSVSSNVWSENTYELDDLVENIIRESLDNKKDFHYIDFITPVSISDITPDTERGHMGKRTLGFDMVLKIQT